MGFLQAGQNPLDQTMCDRVMVAPNTCSQSFSSENSIHGRAPSTTLFEILAAQGNFRALALACSVSFGG